MKKLDLRSSEGVFRTPAGLAVSGAQPAIFARKDAVGGPYEVLIAQDTDDAYEYDDGRMIWNDTIWLTDQNRYGAFKFRLPVTIPQGATIVQAYASLYLKNPTYDQTSHYIWFEDVAAPADLVDEDLNVSNRTLTTNYATWFDNGPIPTSAYADTPSLVAPLQEVVDQYSVNALMLIISQYAFNDLEVGGYGFGFPAKLTIEFEV